MGSAHETFWHSTTAPFLSVRSCLVQSAVSNLTHIDSRLLYANKPKQEGNSNTLSGGLTVGKELW